VELIGPAFLLVAIGIAMEALPRGAGATQSGQPPTSIAANLCRAETDGYLTGELYGSLKKQIDWNGNTMECDGMLRPNEGGIRLVFASPTDSDSQLIILLGIDGSIDELSTGERAANITLIDEVNRRFYNSGRNDRCWSNIETLEQPTSPANGEYTIAGVVYCTGGLPSLSDSSSVTLRNFRFSGRLSTDDH
jgi:hypothetical protein